MSARNVNVVLAPEARTDLRDILMYTARHWGLSQRRAYRKQFDSAFSQLARFPGIGQLHPEIGPGIRVYRVGRHLLIYLPSDTELKIVRIVHVQRDLEAGLGE